MKCKSSEGRLLFPAKPGFQDSKWENNMFNVTVYENHDNTNKLKTC